MRTLTLLFSVLFLLSFSKNTTQNVNIFDAIKNNQIQLVATSNGLYSGESILLEIKKIKNIKSVFIPSGTRFKSEFEDDQDLLVIDEELIVLNSDLTRKNIGGFCVQKHNKAPTIDSRFTISKEENLNTIKVAKYLNKKNFSEEIKQTAIWCTSNESDISGIYEDENKSVKELREYICSVLGRENVWYNTNPVYSVDENRNILQETTKVEGLLSYKVTKTGSMTMEILSENGELFKALGGEMPVSKLGDYSFNFKLEVTGWRSGKYSVQLKIGDNVIHKEDFVIA